ncbi:class 1 fructose-bisphosphatase [Chitinophaga oryziterrae]|nr:class 1 fructose-bisphosphatase [Chitinophaga oryziterrae]
MMRKLMTLEEFTIQELRAFPKATGQLSGLVRDIGLAAKRINVEVNKAGLMDAILGATGYINVQGEEVQKLDVFADNQLVSVLRNGLFCAGIASEENDDILVFDDEVSNNAKYVVLMDPLDGSSNIDVNMPVGTIFSVYRRVTPLGTPCTKEDFLQPGTRIVAAGYIIYGPSTIMVYATRRGVNAFTLDPSIGEFCLCYSNMKCPERGDIYSLNYGNYGGYNDQIKKYIDFCERKKQNGKCYTQRYVGSLVADIHRNLIKGGIFLYPGTAEKPKGKLRLLYECNPMAFIIEMAGGHATNGKQSILSIIPDTLHERSPLFIGSSGMMQELHQYIKGTAILYNMSNAY